MIGIKIKGSFLDLSPSTTIALELVSPVFLGDSASITPGSYSFPFDIPMTERNREILDWPDLVGNETPLLRKEPVELYFDGMRLPIECEGSIQDAGEDSAKLYVVSQPVAVFGDKKLNEIDLGGSRDLGADVVTRVTHAHFTAVTPLDYDYAFFPVRNEAFWENGEAPPHDSCFVQNFYQGHVNGVEFVSHEHQRCAMPFVRLDYVLKRIFETHDLEFINSFQVSDELKKIYIYNNFNIYEEDDWGRYVDLKNHVPETKVTDYLRKVSRLFCLVFMSEPFSASFELLPLSSLLAQPPAHDWTERALRGPVLTQNNEFIDLFTTKRLDDDAVDATLLEAAPQTGIPSFTTYTAAAAQPTGWYRILQLGCYLYVSPFPPAHHHWVNKMRVGTEGGELEVELGVAPSEWRLFTSPQGDVTHHQICPVVKINGTWPSASMKADMPDKLLVYRGIQPLPGQVMITVPVANRVPYDLSGGASGTISFDWSGGGGTAGIYFHFWRQWDNFLHNKTEVTMRLELTLKDILNFRFRDLVRVRNVNYLVRSLRVNLTMQGIEAVEARLVSLV